MENLNYFVVMSVSKGGCLDMTGEGQLLGLATSDRLASDAWIKGKEYEYCSSFSIITGDDNKLYIESKFRMHRPTGVLVKKMLEKCCPSFQKRVKKLCNTRIK